MLPGDVMEGREGARPVALDVRRGHSRRGEEAEHELHPEAEASEQLRCARPGREPPPLRRGPLLGARPGAEVFHLGREPAEVGRHPGREHSPRGQRVELPDVRREGRVELDGHHPVERRSRRALRERLAGREHVAA